MQPDGINETFSLPGNGPCLPEIKICGITDIETAAACVDFGVDAVGLVFYEKSPRFVENHRAKAICDALSPDMRKVGVFVDASYPEIMSRVDECGIDAVQLHGREPSELILRLRENNLLVIKALFVEHPPELNAAAGYPASAFLVECGKGPLPGGSSRAWAWSGAKAFGEAHPLILAGGLSPENVSVAIRQARPDAVDVSSGVESAPGRKDIEKIAAFVTAVFRTPTKHNPRRIFS